MIYYRASAESIGFGCWLGSFVGAALRRLLLLHLCQVRYPWQCVVSQVSLLRPQLFSVSLLRPQLFSLNSVTPLEDILLPLMVFSAWFLPMILSCIYVVKLGQIGLFRLLLRHAWMKYGVRCVPTSWRVQLCGFHTSKQMWEPTWLMYV